MREITTFNDKQRKRIKTLLKLKWAFDGTFTSSLGDQFTGYKQYVHSAYPTLVLKLVFPNFKKG